MNPKAGSYLLTAILAATTAALSTQSSASGFALIENSATGQGNAFAGAAAYAEDATTVWFNPAGMMKLKGNQIVVVGHYISPKADFSNQGSINADGSPSTGGNDDGGRDAYVPNIYWVANVHQDIKFGLGITTPFGLKTEYNDTWVGRYHAVKTDLKTVNINPSIAYQLNDQISLGAGIDIMLADVVFTNAIDFGALTGASGAADGFAKLHADNHGLSNLTYGFNLGLMYDITPKTRLGLAYRSEMTIDVAGSAEFRVPAVAAPVLTTGAFRQTDLNASVTLPQSFSVSVAHDIKQLKLLADVTWTGWNSFNELRIHFNNPNQPDSVTTESWQNTLRYSIGLDWQYSPKITLRTGLAYDESPVPDARHRTARIPGNDRRWLSLGGTYRFNDAFTFDIGYSHLFVSDTSINNTFEVTPASAALAATLKGTYTSSIDIVSAQLRWHY